MSLVPHFDKAHSTMPTDTFYKIRGVLYYVTLCYKAICPFM